MSIIGTDGHVLFTDVVNDAYLYFGGASKNGKRFVIAVSSWLCLAKTSYTCKMNDLAQSSIRTFPI
jgi:hypothetical protein